MGRLVTKGYAEGEFDVEIMNITLRFYAEKASSKAALQAVQKQTEEMLEELSKIGLTPDMVILEDGGVSNGNKTGFFEANKRICIETKVDIKLRSYIVSLVKKLEGNIRYNISYKLASEVEQRKLLLKEAVADSRRQAEAIAESLEMVVVGVESVNDKLYAKDNMLNCPCGCGDILLDGYESDTPLEDAAQLPKVSLDQDIEIAWIMEEK